MSITANVGGVLKKLEMIHANVSGTIKNLSVISANVNGTLKKIFSYEDNPWVFTVNIHSAGGYQSNVTQNHSTEKREAVVGMNLNYGINLDKFQTGYHATYNWSGSFRPRTACTLVYSGSGTLQIDGATKTNGRYSITPSNAVSFSLSVSSSTTSAVSGSITIKLE